MSTTKSRKVAGCRRKLDLSKDAAVPAKKPVISTAVEITTQVDTRQRKATNKQTGKGPKSGLNSKPIKAKPEVRKTRNNKLEDNSRKNASVSETSNNNAIPAHATLATAEMEVDHSDQQEESAYERLLRKVNENRWREKTSAETSRVTKALEKAEVQGGHDLSADLDKSYDGIMVNVNASDDDFDDSEDEERAENSDPDLNELTNINNINCTGSQDIQTIDPPGTFNEWWGVVV